MHIIIFHWNKSQRNNLKDPKFWSTLLNKVLGANLPPTWYGFGMMSTDILCFMWKEKEFIKAKVNDDFLYEYPWLQH